MFKVFILYFDHTTIVKNFSFLKDALDYLQTCEHADIYYVNVTRIDFEEEMLED